MDAMEWAGPLLGGAMIGGAATLLLLASGRQAGISAIVGDLINGVDLRPRDAAEPGDARGWRLAFVAGLVVAGLLMLPLLPHGFDNTLDPGLPVLLGAGLLVGIGTRMGGGCTSGHGVCGNSRLSVRSLVATVTFIATGALAVFVTEHVLGGGP